MTYSLIKRDPEIGYLDSWLWLPKKKVNLDVIKRGLTAPIMTNGELDSMKLWMEAPHHIGVPRARIDPSDLSYDVVDLRPKSFPKADFSSNKIVMDKQMPDRTEQQEAFEDLSCSENGILNMACGRGKTVICLHAIAKWGENALIICNTKQLMRQWVKAATDPELLGMKEEDIGWVQGKPDTWDWKKPLVVASLKSLAMYHDKVALEMVLWFGRIIWDEVHHLSAKEFSKTAPIFPGHRYGASATVDRQDGMEFVYFWHVGQVAHVNLTQDVIPTVLFRKSRTVIDLSHPDVVDRNGQIHHRKLAAYVGTIERELKLAKEIVDEGLSRGRDIVAISMSKDHAQRLHEMTPNSGVLHGDVKDEDERLRMLNDHKITFGTVDMLAEALNKKTLDSLIILTEFKSKKNAQQSTGRIQRLLLDREKRAKVIVLFHVNIPPLRSLGMKLMQYFKRCGFKVKVK